MHFTLTEPQVNRFRNWSQTQLAATPTPGTIAVRFEFRFTQNAAGDEITIMYVVDLLTDEQCDLTDLLDLLE